MTVKTKLQPKQQVRIKPTLIYSSAGIVAAIVVGIAAFFYLNVGTPPVATAATGDIITSLNTSNWNSATGWDLGRRPEDGDRVVIQAGHKKTVSNDTDFDGEIIVNGELEIWNADLIMDAASKVAVSEGGIISFSPRDRFLGIWYATAHLTIGSNHHWLVGWYNGTVVTNPVTGPASFGDDAGELLPIELISFDAAIDENQDVVVTWATASEENNDFFTLERSLDGENFFTLDTIEGAGNSNVLKEYAYKDEMPVAGYNYYRLKQIDFDGKFEYFDIVSVFNDEADSELSVVSIGPNPYRDHFEVDFYSIDNNAVHLKLSDMQGKTVFTKSLEAEKGMNTFTYTDNRNLQPGIYLFTIVQKGTPAKTYRIVKNS